MKNKTNRKFIDRDKMQNIVLKIPYVVLCLLIIIVSPLGVYLFFLKLNKKKNNMYNRGRNLIGFGIFILFLIGAGLYSKVKDIIELYDSGMSLDMMNFIPDNLWLYIMGIIMVISYMYGGKKLIDRAKIEQVYTYRINVDHQESLKTLSDELEISIVEAKNNIKLLQNIGYLVPIEIDNKNNKIIYLNQKNSVKIASNKKQSYREKQCTKCGALVKFKIDEYTECDFCGHGMIDDNN